MTERPLPNGIRQMDLARRVVDYLAGLPQHELDRIWDRVAERRRQHALIVEARHG